MPLYYPTRHLRHLDRALTIAKTSTEKQRHGCVIAKGNRVLSVGVNAPRNDPLVCTDPKAEAGWHAEVAALRSLPSGTDPSRLTLYVARLGRRGVPALSAPCPRCKVAIRDFGIKEVFWTT